MPTKAQAHRTEQARTAKPDKPKRPARQRRDVGVDTAKPGVSATDRKKLRKPDARSHAGRRGGAILERTAVGKKPSRKSTRGSTDHIKLATNLQREAIRKSSAPATRAAKTARKTAKITGRATRT